MKEFIDLWNIRFRLWWFAIQAMIYFFWKTGRFINVDVKLTMGKRSKKGSYMQFGDKRIYVKSKKDNS